MPVRATHYAGSLPFGAALIMYAPVPIPIKLGTAATCYAVSTINDWDHPRRGLRWHPGALLIARPSARLGYRIRTKRDIPRRDLHRGPTHSIEWCLLVGLAVTWLAAGLPGVLEGGAAPTAPYCWWFGLAAFLGTTSHVLLDWMTPSGVPFSAIYNWLRYDRVWRRHACAWEWHPIAEYRAPGIIPREVQFGSLVRDVPTIGLVTRRLAYPTLTVIPVDERHPGCQPGLFRTDEGGEHMLVVPALYVVTGLVILAKVDWLGPIVGGLTGWAV